MKLRIIMLGLALLLLGPAANAQQLSGTYVVNFQRICEVLASGGLITFSGHITNLVGTINFNPSAGTAAVNGITVSGSLINSPTSDMVQKPTVATIAYSTTPTTLVIAGMTLNAVYHRIFNGVSQKVIFNGLVDDQNAPSDCAAVGTLEFAQ